MRILNLILFHIIQLIYIYVSQKLDTYKKYQNVHMVITDVPGNKNTSGTSGHRGPDIKQA